MRDQWISRRATPIAVGVSAIVLAFSAASLASSANGNASTKSKPVSTSRSPSHNSGPLQIQGVVQYVSPSAVSVRLLDGTAANVPYDRKTQVLVNGKPASIAVVKPGFVLTAAWKAGNAASVLRFVKG